LRAKPAGERLALGQLGGASFLGDLAIKDSWSSSRHQQPDPTSAGRGVDQRREVAVLSTKKEQWLIGANDVEFAHMAKNDEVIARLMNGIDRAIDPSDDLVKDRRSVRG